MLRIALQSIQAGEHKSVTVTVFQIVDRLLNCQFDLDELRHCAAYPLSGFPIGLQLSAWYSGIGLTGLILLLALTLYAFHTSLGGQPLFGRASLED